MFVTCMFLTHRMFVTDFNFVTRSIGSRSVNTDDSNWNHLARFANIIVGSKVDGLGKSGRPFGPKRTFLGPKWTLLGA